jgi:hypothetical protein
MARLSVVDTAAGDETYDLYVYDASLDLVASSHPFAADGTTDVAANDERGPSTEATPTVVELVAPAAGRHYLAVNRARIGQSPLEPAGDFGSYRLTLDEIGASGDPRPTALTYDGDQVVAQGSPMRLAATLTDADGRPIAGRTVTFSFDSPRAVPAGPVPPSQLGRHRPAGDGPDRPRGRDPRGHAAFAGMPSSGLECERLVLVLGSGLPALPGGTVSGGAWFVPDGRATGLGDTARVHLAVHASGSVSPSGQLRYRDGAAGLDLTLISYTALSVSGEHATLTGTARGADGGAVAFRLEITDGGEPGRGADTVRMRLPSLGYDASGWLGGGNLRVQAS